MLKSLFKNELLRFASVYFYSSKKKKMRSAGGIIGIALLFFLLFVSVAFAFYGIASLFVQFTLIGLDWFYFLMFALIALALGTVGSVFFTYSGIYQAKDNDLLLSMPIKPSKILFVRLASIYGTTLMFEALPLIPCYLKYWIKCPVTPLQVVFQILFFFIFGLLILSLTSILGFLVAFVTSKIKNKTFFTVIFSFALLALYYFVYFRLNSYLQLIVKNVDKYSKNLSKYYLLLKLGQLFTGDIGGFFLVSGIIIALFALVYFVLSVSYIKIVTKKTGARKTKYNEKAIKTASIQTALLKKEFRRFFGSVAYLMNCGLMIVIILAFTVFILIKRETVSSYVLQFLTMFNLKEYLPLAVACAVSFFATTCDISAASVSLEGKNLWILKSCPVNPRYILNAKLNLHYSIVIIPAILFTSSLCFVFKLNAVSIILDLLFVIGIVILSAVLGLALNLKFPNFDWTNETVPVKQGIPVTVCFLGGWVISIACAVVCYLIKHYLFNQLNVSLYLLALVIIIFVADYIIYNWIMKKGSDVFSYL